MGQSGLTMGLALYEDLKALRRLWTGDGDDEDNARQTVATSVTFGEEWDIPVADLEAAKQHGWQVARPDAYPAVFHKERGLSHAAAAGLGTGTDGGVPAGGPGFRGPAPAGRPDAGGGDRAGGVGRVEAGVVVGGGLGGGELRHRPLFGMLSWRRGGGRPMPKILDNGKFRVYVYANDDNPHHLPHCHVYWDGDDHASVVSLPDLVVIVGDTLPRAARRYLRANVDVLMAAWRRLNP